MKTVFLSFSIADSSVTDFFLQLSNLLSERFRVVVITDNVRPHSFFISENVEILNWPSKRPNSSRDFIFLFQQVRKYKPEMMISIFGAVNIFIICGFLFGVKHRIVWRRSITGQFKVKASLDFRKRLIYKLASTIFANSRATKVDLIKNFGVPEEKVKVVYNAVRELRINTGPVINEKIVYVGRMHPSKGIDTLLEAMPPVLKEFPKVQLTIVGGFLHGREFERLKGKTYELGIEGNVLFIGNQLKKKVMEELSSAYFSVVPSLIEAFGFVVIESFSVKTPVIGSNTSGIAEIVRDGKDGFLFEPKNSDELAGKMLKLLKNHQLREKFGQSAYERFRSEFEIHVITARLYRKLGKWLDS